ncbi:hypothetical protein [Flavivirga spongiicola]|uniref:Uncharacterized protein n=1 Tax=Flavivirga spongiicola TaxID=421621 RepID=A0ABU7XUA3_9FLAO|nr:hypothetical protein [Flavivirga sp. MEBiC05379]MDO5978422.1 hypothetical protein [Flavivirga sp. MEBiC05379]
MFTFKKKAIKEDAKFIIDIVSNYSNDESIKKLISPISDEYFLIDDKNKISICISDGEVTLSNHAFLYKKLFNLSLTDRLKKQIKEAMEQEMQFLKESLFKNETELLSKILNLSTKKNNPYIIKPNFKTS